MTAKRKRSLKVFDALATNLRAPFLLSNCPMQGNVSWKHALPEVHHLSAYEFAREFDFALASHPTTQRSHEKHMEDPGKYHAVLTAKGVAEAAKRRPDMLPGLHYTIREEGGPGASWLPLGDGEHAQPYRHDWIILPRRRPYVPVIFGAQGRGRSFLRSCSLRQQPCQAARTMKKKPCGSLHYSFHG